MRWYAYPIIFVVTFCAVFLLWPTYVPPDPYKATNAPDAHLLMNICAGVNAQPGTTPQDCAEVAADHPRLAGGYSYLRYSFKNGFPSKNSGNILDTTDGYADFRPLIASTAGAITGAAACGVLYVIASHTKNRSAAKKKTT